MTIQSQNINTWVKETNKYKNKDQVSIDQMYIYQMK